VALRILLTWCAVGAVCTATALASTKPAITPNDNGKTFTVQRGGTLTLRLPEQNGWLNPRVTGSAVRLTPVMFFRDPGYRQWSIAALARGTAMISVVRYAEPSKRGCDPGPCAPRLLRLSIRVH
jgi:hypothetical protein